jgi:N-acetylneuraminic acid mutarotase
MSGNPVQHDMMISRPAGRLPARRSPGHRRSARWIAGVVAVFFFPAAALADWSWGQAAPLPEQRTEVSAVSDGEAIYVLGGFGVAEGRGTAPTGVYRYTPAGDAWEKVADLPEGVNHTGIVILEGKLYVVGGYRAASFDPVADLRILDLATMTWSEGAPLPTPRGALAVTELGGRIHAIGGTTAAGTVALHEIYDPATNSWQEAAPLTIRRNHHTAAAHEGRIYVFGGRDESTFRQTVSEVFDPATGQWQAIADLPTGRSGIASAVLNGVIVVFGGESSGPLGRTYDDAEAYDPATNSWTVLPPMPIARHGLGAATVGNSIHVISGGPRPGLTFSDVHQVLTFTP